MSANSKNTIYSPTDGNATAVSADDVEMVNVSESNGAKTIEEIQTQKDVDIQPIEEKIKLKDVKLESNTSASTEAVLDSTDEKSTRNVQTQHGDDRVDVENTFLIPRCLWPEEKMKYMPLPSTSSDNAESADGKTADEEEKEQVVWIEPFANEVSVRFNANIYLFIKNI